MFDNLTPEQQAYADAQTSKYMEAPHALFFICREHFACTDKHHVSEAKKLFRDAITLDLHGFATKLHHRGCDMWAQQAHGAYYTAMAERSCGPAGERHIAHIAALPWVRAVHAAHHKAAQN